VKRLLQKLNSISHITKNKWKKREPKQHTTLHVGNLGVNPKQQYYNSQSHQQSQQHTPNLGMWDVDSNNGLSRDYVEHPLNRSGSKTGKSQTRAATASSSSSSSTTTTTASKQTLENIPSSENAPQTQSSPPNHIHALPTSSASKHQSTVNPTSAAVSKDFGADVTLISGGMNMTQKPNPNGKTAAFPPVSIMKPTLNPQKYISKVNNSDKKMTGGEMITGPVGTTTSSSRMKYPLMQSLEAIKEVQDDDVHQITVVKPKSKIWTATSALPSPPPTTTTALKSTTFLTHPPPSPPSPPYASSRSPFPSRDSKSIHSTTSSMDRPYAPPSILYFNRPRAPSSIYMEAAARNRASLASSTYTFNISGNGSPTSATPKTPSSALVHNAAAPHFGTIDRASLKRPHGPSARISASHVNVNGNGNVNGNPYTAVRLQDAPKPKFRKFKNGNNEIHTTTTKTTNTSTITTISETTGVGGDDDDDDLDSTDDDEEGATWGMLKSHPVFGGSSATTATFISEDGAEMGLGERDASKSIQGSMDSTSTAGTVATTTLSSASTLNDSNSLQQHSKQQQQQQQQPKWGIYASRNSKRRNETELFANTSMIAAVESYTMDGGGMDDCSEYDGFNDGSFKLVDGVYVL
jgi:hypothetical protein